MEPDKLLEGSMIIETDREIEDRIGNGGILLETLKEYLAQLMNSFSRANTSVPHVSNPEKIAEEVFDILTRREFCYLSRLQVVPYKEEILEQVRRSVREGEPIHFYFDIGGGYHASIKPGESGLCFGVGLAELFILRQISMFCRKVGEQYLGGAVFQLVIDNLCARLINDIPIDKTIGYCESLRNLIREMGMEEEVGVIVESEHFSSDEYSLPEGSPHEGCDLAQLTLKERENVSRFLGRPCDASEAAERLRRYKEVMKTSDRLLSRLIRGIHMTQRAGERTICFRPFPGADSRVQCGEVAIGRNNKDKLRPFLLTSSNIREYACTRFQFADLLPKGISYVTYAEHQGDG